MGEIYLAEDLVLGQEIALKMLPRGLENRHRALDRLLDEVRIARSISHPNVCRVYDIGEMDGLRFLAMEHLEGEDLAVLLRRVGRLSASRVIEIGVGICRGLAAIHACGILHRDLKPANLLLTADGQPRIADFGLAVLADTVPYSDLRSGTPAYMAPEQHAGNDLTQRSDLYALGVMLYELLTGERPFGKAPISEMARRHREEMPRPPSHHVSGVPSALEQAILSCLAKDPRYRPASAEELADALLADSFLPAGTAVRTAVISDLTEHLHGEMARPHDARTRSLLQKYDGHEIKAGASRTWLFERPWDAVRFALAYQVAAGLSGESLPPPALGVHLGEITVRRSRTEDAGEATQADGPAVAGARWLCGLAGSGQILLDRYAYELARQAANAALNASSPLRWRCHGLKSPPGGASPVDVFGVEVEVEVESSATARGDRGPTILIRADPRDAERRVAELLVLLARDDGGPDAEPLAHAALDHDPRARQILCRLATLYASWDLRRQLKEDDGGTWD